MLLEDDQRHNKSQCSNMNKSIHVILHNAIVLMNRYLFRISLINFSIVLSWEEDSRLINEYHYGFFFHRPWSCNKRGILPLYLGISKELFKCSLYLHSANKNITICDGNANRKL